MNCFNFHMPTRVFFGKDRISELGRCIDPAFKRILIVTEPNVAHRSGALDKTLEQLSGRDVTLFTNVEENPSFQVIEKGRQMARGSEAQLVIGIGGGSPMDAAKGIAVLSTNDGDMRDFISGEPLREGPLPIMCIPTTSGTGSEVTPYAVFTDRDAGTKGGYAHPKLFPTLSIVDPVLTYSMPESVVVNTGLDVLTHSIEAYLSTISSPMNDVIALESINIVLDHLKEATKKNTAAMDEMAYASMLGGLAIAHGGTILLHVMGYPLTIFHGVPHGRANAALLPEFVRFMGERSTVRPKVHFLERLFDAHGGLEVFVNDLGVSTRLSSYGVRDEEIAVFVKKVIVKDDVRITPAAVTEEIIAELYRAVM
ncbi:MAG: iron-containing alcohol dehydrogenase [Gemmatimonadota bacterium]|nr:MAG: iron-containing alcohol dehydrogenase [Gemmatimonadota bacterium]